MQRQHKKEITIFCNDYNRLRTPYQIDSVITRGNILLRTRS